MTTGRKGSLSRDGLPLWVQRAKGFCLTFLVVAATIWVAAMTLFSVPLLVYALLAAVLLAALLAPAVRWLAKRGLPRWLAAALAVLLSVLVTFGSAFYIVRRALGQVDDLRGAISQALADLHDRVVNGTLGVSEQTVDEVRDLVIQFVSGLIPSPSAGAALALHLLTGIAITVFVLFFLLKDGPSMRSWLLGWTPAHHRARMDQIADRVWRTLGHYVRGMMLVALVDAVAIGAALFILGVPLAASLTILVFVGAFVPILGATVSGAVAAAVTAVTLGTWQAVVVVVVVVVVQQLEGNVLQPLIMGRAVDLHPVVILLAVTAGGLFAGIGGAVLAVPLVAVGYCVLYTVARTPAPEVEPTSPSRVHHDQT